MIRITAPVVALELSLVPRSALGAVDGMQAQGTWSDTLLWSLGFAIGIVAAIFLAFIGDGAIRRYVIERKEINAVIRRKVLMPCWLTVYGLYDISREKASQRVHRGRPQSNAKRPRRHVR